MTTKERIEQLRKETAEGGNTSARVADILYAIIADFEAFLVPIGFEFGELEDIKKELEIIRGLLDEHQPLKWQ